MVLSADRAVLLLVDLQERLVPAMHDADTVVGRAVRLAEAAQALGVPVRATQQNPAGLGPTVSPLAGYPQATLAKTAFSAVADPDFAALLPSEAPSSSASGSSSDRAAVSEPSAAPVSAAGQVVIAGCEAHVCVLQTVLDLLAAGRSVAVVADATGSRDPADKAAALERARQHGAEIVTSEMVLFEWLRDAAHPKFRHVQKLLK